MSNRPHADEFVCMRAFLFFCPSINEKNSNKIKLREVLEYFWLQKVGGDESPAPRNQGNGLSRSFFEPFFGSRKMRELPL